MSVRRVFLSSTVQGLQPCRDAVAQAINSMHDYKCVRMEDFTPSPRPAIDVCLKHLKECEIYVGIIGHNYGSYAPGVERSYTEVEFDAAVEWGVPTLMFLASDDFPVAAKDIDDDKKREAQRIFRTRVSEALLRSTFETPSDLSLSVIRALQDVKSSREPVVEPNGTTVLLFPFITNQAGFDTGLSISNTSARPRTSTQKPGACTFYYYGSSAITPTRQISECVLAGQQLTYVLSSGGSHGILATPAFQGYLIVECDFSDARGFAMIFDGPVGLARVASGYTAEVIEVGAYRPSTPTSPQ